MKVVFFGKKDDSSHAAFAEIAARHEIVGIVESSETTFPNWKACLLQMLGRFSLQGYALIRRIPYFNYSPYMKSPELVSFLSALSFEVGCIGVFQRLIPESVFKIPKNGFINIHPSLLPKYRGPLPDFWQFWNQDSDGGVTVHVVDKGEDTGAILAQVPIRIESGRNIYDYTKECMVKGAREVCRILEEPQPFQTRPQPDDSSFRARKLTDEDVLIDWSWPIERIYHVMTPALSMTEVFREPKFPWNLFSWTPVRFDKKTQQSRLTGELRINGEPQDLLIRNGKAVLQLADGDLIFDHKFRVGKALTVIACFFGEWL